MMRFIITLTIVCAVAAGAVAQLPPDAVDLAKVKIPEAQKTAELDPVTLQPADPALPTWEYEGVTYGGSAPESKETFLKDPSKYLAQAEKQRWENNFIAAMSRIWCPVTDEINTGGGLIWHELGLEWESCCQFCNDTKAPEDFPAALQRLKKRAALAFEKTGGTYVEGASSPVEGAIDLTGGVLAAADSGAEGSGSKEQANALPTYMEGKDLKPAYTKGIAVVFENRCLECHRLGGPAPMAFTTYQDIRKWSKKLKETIETGAMPPWPAAPTNTFANSKALTPPEKELILQWIEQGYPMGEGQYTPENNFAAEWTIGEPDHVFDLPAYTLPEDAGEHVKEFEIETNFDGDKWIVANEVKPTDTFSVLYIEAGPLGSYHPGNSGEVLRDGAGYLLKKGETINVRVFYLKEPGWEVVDDMTQFAVKFADDPAAIKYAKSKTRAANESFTIPAGAADVEISTEFAFDADATLLSLLPVMRERGKSVACTAVLPNGKEQTLLTIPHWDPAWQFEYVLNEPLELPKGAVVKMVAKYDNSDMNARNPNPGADVSAGPGGEVLEGWIAYSPK